MVFDNASTQNGAAAPARTVTLTIADVSNITVDLAANRLYAADTTGLSIIANASTASGTPVINRVLAPSGSVFKAVAVAP
jgi:hypothetical protein